MNIRFFIRPNNTRIEDFKFEDDVDDPLFKSRETLGTKSRTFNTFTSVLLREKSGLSSIQELGQTLVPNTYLETSVEFDSSVYNCGYFNNGQNLYCSSQEEIKVFDVSDPEKWECVNSYFARNVRWTLTDVDVSPDSKYLIYSSMGSALSILRLDDDPLNLLPNQDDHQSILLNNSIAEYGVFSCKFSGSGTEVLVGTRVKSLEIHDLVLKKIAYKVTNAHDDDINTACFDSVDSQVIYSGSDDCRIKIWDRRSQAIRPQGFLIGHREGITKISAKGDGFHLISNGKDQCLKLWDIRKMNSSSEFQSFLSTHRNYSTEFNYQMGNYELANYTKKLSIDHSLLTFRGHKVLSTLIRCYFSPLESTGQRYVYSGSADGKVYIYDTYTGKKAAELRPRVERGFLDDHIIRDVSWHPSCPIITATSFDCCVHQFCYN